MTRQEEVDRNYAAFAVQLPELLDRHRGRFALMRDREILGFYASADEAGKAGDASFDDGLYSIQLVSPDPIDLGYFNHAVPVD